MNFPYNKALVTGGAGFIGSHLVDALVDLGVHTVSVDNYSAGKQSNLEHLAGRDNFQEANCDITDLECLESFFHGVEVVFHLAASKKTICLTDPRRDLDVNAKGAFNLLELSHKYGVKKYVQASTGSVYGEPQYYPQDEKHPLMPTSYYGVSKLAGEKYVAVYNHLYDLDTTVLRYFHVYGPRQESSDVGGVVSIFIRLLLANQPIIIFGDGTQQRSFTYVKDVVQANLLAAASPDSTGEVFNCASGIKITIGELAYMLIDALEVENPHIKYADWTPGDIKVFDVDNRKIRTTLGLNFLTDFALGLDHTIAWARDFFEKENPIV